MRKKFLRILTVTLSLLTLFIVLLTVEPPQSLSQASVFQIAVFFIPLFLFLTFLFHIIFSRFFTSLVITSSLIALLILKGLDQITIPTVGIVLTAAVLVSKIKTRLYKDPSQKKIPKLSKI